MQGIKDKKVLITAGATGIGKATAIAMMKAGAQVHVCDIDDQALASFKQDYPLLLTSVTNVTKPDEVAEMFVQLQQNFSGKLVFWLIMPVFQDLQALLKPSTLNNGKRPSMLIYMLPFMSQSTLYR